jgi:hypothetical protein
MLRANLRLVARAADHIIFFGSAGNKARFSELSGVAQALHQRPAGADQPEYGQLASRDGSTALCALRNGSLATGRIALPLE